MNDKTVLLLLGSVVLLASGLVDLDWMIVAPRFNSWYYSVSYWEFSPFFKMGWWNAYFYTIMRTILGFLGLGYVVGKETKTNELDLSRSQVTSLQIE